MRGQRVYVKYVKYVWSWGGSRPLFNSLLCLKRSVNQDVNGAMLCVTVCATQGEVQNILMNAIVHSNTSLALLLIGKSVASRTLYVSRECGSVQCYFYTVTYLWLAILTA